MLLPPPPSLPPSPTHLLSSSNTQNPSHFLFSDESPQEMPGPSTQSSGRPAVCLPPSFLETPQLSPVKPEAHTLHAELGFLFIRW